ncbi:hypothetical protein BC6307_06715 [Sutcliffiella cohnii]|uniref:ABC transporter domain-containing protein n=1 Tax=Sutcliffiella cohnii TaxID=33932 RepID=A0A223KNT3_9BACI|nr:hypothetical protein BC6307_06715 [Sutcliffiella cohnii]
MDILVQYKIENVSFAYPNSDQPSLTSVSFEVEEGDFVVLCGPSGSGKTTLLRHLKMEVRPVGTLSGSIFYNGKGLEEIESTRLVEEIGIVFQDPDNQLVMNTVWQELVFAMENLAYSSEKIQRRLAEVVQFFGMEEWLHIPVHQLSGGQKQLVNVAAVMALRPKVLLLDEPTAQLDPIATRDFLQLLVRINEEFSTTIVMSEHRLDETLPIANKVVFLKNGSVCYANHPAVVLQHIWDEQKDSVSYIPAISRFYFEVNSDPHHALPLTVKEAKRWWKASGLSFTSGDLHKKDNSVQEEVLFQCKNIVFQYEKDTPPILKNLSLSVQKGELFMLFGGNGSGKSTFLQSIAGAITPQRGKMKLLGRDTRKIPTQEKSTLVAYVHQNPALYFTKETVKNQLDDRIERLPNIDEAVPRLAELVSVFELKDVLHKHPFDISGGQQQKVVLALALLANPALLLLDEPTKGLDPVSKLRLSNWLKGVREKGTTIIMVSHDVEFAALNATKCGMLFDGQIHSVEEKLQFLRENFFYTTSFNRAFGEECPNAITEKDVTIQWPTRIKYYT